MKNEEMLKLARQAITNVDDKAKIAELSKQKGKKVSGIFVSVYMDDELRGCIGSLEPVNIIEGIIKNSIFAAYHDPRFVPIRKNEFSRMKISINLLSESKKLSYANTEDLKKRIKGKGVIIEKGFRRATYLPSVWEQLPLAEDFLSSLCMKAGLHRDEWKKNDTMFFTYESDEFSD